jgi:hypothetical protein
MDPVSRSHTGAALQVRQKKTWNSTSVSQNSPSVTLHGDSFHSSQKSAIHFAGGRGKTKEGAKDGEESTLFKGFIVWQGNYLTKQVYQEEKAKNDAIWAGLMAGSSSTTQSSAEPETAEDWSRDPVDLGAGFHNVGSHKAPTTTSQPVSSSPTKKTRDQEVTEYMAARAGKSTDELWEEWQKSFQQPDEEDWEYQERTLKQSAAKRHQPQIPLKEPKPMPLSHSVSVLKPDGERAPIRSVSPLKEENEHAGPSTGQVAVDYDSDTSVDRFRDDGVHWWQKVRRGNRTQPGVYKQVTF